MKKMLSVVWGAGCLLMVSAAWAGVAKGTETPDLSRFFLQVVSTLVFGVLGILLAILGFKLFDFFTPFNLEEEIAQKHNLAVGILCGAMVFGICLIVAAAII